jgi:hypothetical protein
MLSAPSGRGAASGPRAARHPRWHPPDHRRIQFRRPNQQSPAPLGGGLVKAEWFKRYDKERPESFKRIVQSWDTANKATELSDFSVCTTWGVRGKNLYLLGLVRQRLEYPALKRAVREQQSLYDATEVLIEDKASGTQLIQELIADGCHGVTRYQPECDKIMRLHAQTAIVYRHRRGTPPRGVYQRIDFPIRIPGFGGVPIGADGDPTMMLIFADLSEC